MVEPARTHMALTGVYVHQRGQARTVLQVDFDFVFFVLSHKLRMMD